MHLRFRLMAVGLVALVGCGPAPQADPCADVACSGHGTCAVSGTSAVCNCVSGYHASGLQCLVDSSACAQVTCSGHGTCVASGTSATCQCTSGYHASGVQCVADSNACAGVTCSGHGVCAVSGGSAVCQCDTGYSPTGTSCVLVLSRAGCCTSTTADASGSTTVCVDFGGSGYTAASVQASCTPAATATYSAGYCDSRNSVGACQTAPGPTMSTTYYYDATKVATLKPRCILAGGNWLDVP